MSKAGSGSPKAPQPLWLLAELTYACPLQCPYCSNPVDFAGIKDELSAKEWLDVLRQARALGAAQLGFSGGEPLVRRDLEDLVDGARALGFYTNLITSGIGLDAARIAALKEAGLDHIQLSFQAGTAALNDYLAGSASFQQKRAAARLIKEHAYPMVLNVVLHRHNIDQTQAILELAIDLGADYVELANAQYYGWALLNRDLLLPSRDQVRQAEAVAHQYQQDLAGRMKIYYVVSDYHESRPKACMNGWGNVFLTVAPDGTALPCQAARQLPNLSFPNVRDAGLAWIWQQSPAFNAFRGFDWMPEPCRTCPERYQDFGGCRCQAFQLTGDARAADPVCEKSAHRSLIEGALAAADLAAQTQPGVSPDLVFRNTRPSKSRG